MELLLVSCLIGLIRQSSGIMCSQCDSDVDSYCLDHPPIPRNCSVCVKFDHYTEDCISFREVEYCIIEKRYNNETMIRITRDCSPASMPETCEYITQYATLIRVCYTTCKYNGCNMATRYTIYSSCMYYYTLSLIYFTVFF